jgi:hypothetical protein
MAVAAIEIMIAIFPTQRLLIQVCIYFGFKLNN